MRDIAAMSKTERRKEMAACFSAYNAELETYRLGAIRRQEEIEHLRSALTAIAAPDCRTLVRATQIAVHALNGEEIPERR